MKLRLEAINVAGSERARVHSDPATIETYAIGLKRGDKFPPIDVFKGGGEHWLGDGFHRYHAHELLGLKTIECEIHPGGELEAFLFAAGANDKHGLRRSNEDKRHMVRLFFRKEATKDWTDRRIAAAAGVSHPFVAEVRREVVTVTTSTRRGVNGKEYSPPPDRILAPGPVTVLEPGHALARSLSPEQLRELLEHVPPELVQERAREIRRGLKADRRENDRYDTDPRLASAICQRVDELLRRDPSWNGGPRRILEPSCGGGAFLVAIRKQWPAAKVTAVDIEKRCKPTDPAIEWHHADFLDLEAAPFDLVIGNPPYKLAEEFKAKAQALQVKDGLTVYLLGVNFLGGQERGRTMYADTGGGYLAMICPRPDYTGDGGAPTESAAIGWFKESDITGEWDRVIWWKDPEKEPAREQDQEEQD